MKMKNILLGAAGTISAACVATPAMAQDFLLGQIIEVPYNFCPRGFADTNGQLLAISQNAALFALLGTTYGGNGSVTFALPDLRGRVALHLGTGQGLSPFTLGQKGGTENTTLTVQQMPVHNHVGNLLGVSVAPDSEKVKKAALATFPAGTLRYNRTLAPDTVMATGAVTVDNAGGNQPFSVRDPFLVVRFCIALEGIFPSQN
ncbi:MAG: tail fiber protein [Pseudomonadota bacterium]